MVRVAALGNGTLTCMNIGIFAGTFDPVHNGHIEFAKKAITTGHLDRVIIVAEKEPYRKKPHASWDHRQAMIERATETIEQVDHDYAFAALLSHQHTMKDMLTKAEQHYGAAHKYWFLVGSDLFEHMNKWHDVIKQHEYGGFIAALRDEHTAEWVVQKQTEAHEAGFEITVKLIENPSPHVSSSRIRSAIQAAQPIAEVPTNVVDYISSHALYLVK